MYELKIPASHDEIEAFVGKAYREPMLGIYSSNIDDWAAERETILEVALSKTTETTRLMLQRQDPIKWFLAIPMFQLVGDVSYQKILEDEPSWDAYYPHRHDLRRQLSDTGGRLFLGYSGKEILAHGHDAARVAHAAIREAWSLLYVNDENEKTGDLEAVKAMVGNVSVVRVGWTA